MRALILNGANDSSSYVNMVGGIVADTIKNAGWQVESIDLRNKKIATCTGCFGCWLRTPGECIINDDGRNVAKEIIRSDLVVFLSPVVFGGYSYELKKALDRVIPLILPTFVKVKGEMHHGRRYDRYPKLVSIGVMKEQDDEAAEVYEKLAVRNALNFHSPAYGACTLIVGTGTDDAGARIDAALKSVEVIA